MSRQTPRIGGQLREARGKSIACSKCHARKIRCSGERPCSGCIQASCESECTYPKRDRQLRVSQNYLEEILSENARFRQLNRSTQLNSGVEATDVPLRAARDGESNDGPIRNPLFDDRPWFFHTSTLAAPILIGEAADAAFTTRLRQTLSDGAFGHIPRVNYPSDSTLLSLGGSVCPLPTPGRARFLLRAALRIVSNYYHMVLKSVVLEGLEIFLRQPATSDILLTSKMWALLALGEAYSSRSGSSDPEFPGLQYFSQANRALQVIQERPSLDSIEVLLLLSLYSLTCNRRHSAYILAGSAVRRAIIMGLHLNVPEAQLKDRMVREHRNRIWWAAYEMDRVLATKLSQPVAVQDDDFQVDMPSNAELPPSRQDDFADADRLIARIKLAKLSGQMTKLLYGRRTQKKPFLQRVQQTLKDLQDWVQSLAGDLQATSYRSLLLSFNQCMIVATRPVLLYVLRANRDKWTASTNEPKPEVPENVQALTDACIRSARHSFSVLMESWVDGSFLTFDFFNTQYLFSITNILAISGVLKGQGSGKDADDFEVALQLLSELKQSGNCAAVEFHQHAEAVKACISGIMMPSLGPMHTHRADSMDITAGMNGASSLGYQHANALYGGFMTAGMALAEPSMQDFLSQTDPNFQQMDISILEHELDGFYWPES